MTGWFCMHVKPAQKKKCHLLLVIPLSVTLSSKLVSFPKHRNLFRNFFLKNELPAVSPVVTLKFVRGALTFFSACAECKWKESLSPSVVILSSYCVPLSLYPTQTHVVLGCVVLLLGLQCFQALCMF